MKEGKKGGEERGIFIFFLREKKWNVCLWKGLSGHFHIGRDRYPVGVIVCGGGGEGAGFFKICIVSSLPSASVLSST